MEKSRPVHYYYRCFSCEKQYSAAEIEGNNVYLCPSCGAVDEKEPLRGVLLIEYDYKYIHKQLTEKIIRSIPQGQFWRYPLLWPLVFSEEKDVQLPVGISRKQLDVLALPPQLFFDLMIEGRSCWIMDDTRNPTFSYKDRASVLVAFKAIQLGKQFVAVASTGNAGSSMAGICARLGLAASIWVPENIPDSKRLQIQAYGAKLHLVKGDYDNAFDVCLKVSKRKNWYNRNTAYNPLTVEGKKSGAYDIYIQFGRQLPDYIFVPCGDGVILGGLFKGFWELRKLGWIEEMPRLIAVQSTGSDALVRFMSERRFQYQAAATLADSICAGAPRNLYMAASALDETGGRALSVSDAEILSAQKILANHTGMLAEPAAAAVVAGYLKFREGTIPGKDTKVLLMLTGNGLKDMQAVEQWSERPSPGSEEEWLEYYH